MLIFELYECHLVIRLWRAFLFLQVNCTRFHTVEFTHSDDVAPATNEITPSRCSAWAPGSCAECPLQDFHGINPVGRWSRNHDLTMAG